MKITTLCLLISLFFCKLSFAQELELTEEKDNVVSSRLEGTWVIEPELTQRLTGDKQAIESEGGLDLTSISFEADPSLIDDIPEEFKKIFLEDDIPIYLAGWMTTGEEKMPFFLTELMGNPHILFFIKGEEDEFGEENLFADGESFNVMLVVAEETENDLFFIGGDFNNQAFNAYQRKQD